MGKLLEIHPLGYWGKLFIERGFGSYCLVGAADCCIPQESITGEAARAARLGAGEAVYTAGACLEEHLGTRQERPFLLQCLFSVLYYNA